jgi:DNA-binding transcriptional LysR family regulator
MDRFQAMTAFVTVADLEGFAPAARRLKLSPSVVTRLVAGLEGHLGTRLLQRTTRSVKLTDSGARYLERARRIVADLAEAEATAQAERTTPSGRFVVTAPNVFGRLHVAPLICRYLETFPAVRGELTLGDRAVNLVDEGIDAAVRIGSLSDSAVVARHVGATRRVVVGAPRYLRRHKPIRRPEALPSHPLIHFSGLGPTAQWSFSRRGEPRTVAFEPALVTNSADAAIGHAERGGGLTMVLAYQVADAVRAKRLEVVLDDFEPPPLPIHVLYPSTRLLSAKVRAFVDLIATTCDWQFVDL